MAETLQEQQLKEAIKNYVMPRVDVGDPIVWHSEGVHGSGQMLGFVKKVSDRSIDIQIPLRGIGFKEYTGVKHATDPSATQAHRTDVGMWSESPLCKRIAVLEEAVERMMRPANKNPNENMGQKK